MIDEVETPRELARVRAIHPSSSLEALFALHPERLRLTLLVSRDVYHGGTALEHRRHYTTERLRMAAEILELRAHYAGLTALGRKRVRLGVQRVGKGSDCVFPL